MFEKITYHDKNNNAYKINGALLEYNAIKAIESSSGVYDGGKDQYITLYENDLIRLNKIISAIKGSTTNKRSMGSSSLKIDGSKYFLAYNSKPQKDLEAILRKIISSPHKQLTHSEHSSKNHGLQIHLVLDGLKDKINIASAFRLSEAMGVKKLCILDSGYSELNHQMVKISRHTNKYLDYKFLDRDSFDLDLYVNNDWLILGLEITDKSVDLRSYPSFETRPILLIIGSEQYGITQELLNATNSCLHIPMFGQNSSMNVIQAAGICIFSLIQNSKTS